MKKLVVFAVVLFSAAVVSAQKRENYEYLGGNEQVQFYVNYKDGSGTFTDVVFYGAIVDGEKGLLSTFRGNCAKQTVATIKAGNQVIEKPVASVVSKGSPIEAALNLTCRKRFGEFI